MDLYEAETLYCPACNGDLTLAKPERGAPRPPKPGDQTVCSHCLSYLRYMPQVLECRCTYISGCKCPKLLQLDPIDRDEFERLPEQLQAGLMQVRGELLQLQEEGRNTQPTRFEAVLATELTKLKQRVAVLETEHCLCYYCGSGDGLNCTHKRRIG